ncbi:MAG: GHMP kinase [Dorea sp.]|jgi:D-glycero-alpha-D-manno-heptose-7-phosphate kinase|nr:GHMP kinase [Dorea sp.]
MIITKTPFRVSFCGGGSDIADFYKNYGGCVLSTTINRYMYLTIHPYFDETQTVLKYSQNEIVNNIHDIDHSIFHCILNEQKVSGVEISSTADVPSGTGLGSSSSFTVGLLHTLACYKGEYVSKSSLAKEACAVEIEKLGAPIGKQDQYAAAFGGLNFISFHKDDTVSVEPIVTKGSTLKKLQKNLVMFYTGLVHNANHILSVQKKNISQTDKTKNLIQMCGLAKDMKISLENNNIEDFGAILHESWMKKKELANSISNPKIDEMYRKAIENGAIGGKLLGAGGGGFFLFYCPEEKQILLREKLRLKPFPFEFEHDGSSIVYIGDRYWEGV